MICTKEKSNDPIVDLNNTLLAKILNESGIKIMFKPIISLRASDIYGYVSLSRGPKGIYKTARVFYAAAYKKKDTIARMSRY